MFDDNEISELEGVRDAATILTDRYNEICQVTGDFNVIEEHEMLHLLTVYAKPGELARLMTDDFSRGLLVGKMLTLHDVDIFLDQESTDDEETYS